MKTGATPKVSIIMPAYNTAGLIKGSLDSVFSQTYSDFEILVVNDGSPDTPQLEQVLQPYLDRIIYVKQENKRAAGARNTAIRHARGEFLAFLDSDDCWLPCHLAAQMNRLAQDPALDLVYANGMRIGDPRRQVEFMRRCPSTGAATFEALVMERCQIPVSTVVARKSTIVAAGGFSEELARCDDYDMWLRAAFHGAKISYGRQLQAKFNGGRPGSLGESSVRMLEAYLIILEKALATLPLNREQRNLVSARAAQIKARYLVEMGKCKVREQKFSEARTLFSSANESLGLWKVRLASFGLSVAPHATSKLIEAWNRVVDESLYRFRFYKT